THVAQAAGRRGAAPAHRGKTLRWSDFSTERPERKRRAGVSGARTACRRQVVSRERTWRKPRAGGGRPRHTGGKRSGGAIFSTERPERKRRAGVSGARTACRWQVVSRERTRREPRAGAGPPRRKL